MVSRLASSNSPETPPRILFARPAAGRPTSAMPMTRTSWPYWFRLVRETLWPVAEHGLPQRAFLPDLGPGARDETFSKGPASYGRHRRPAPERVTRLPRRLR